MRKVIKVYYVKTTQMKKMIPLMQEAFSDVVKNEILPDCEALTEGWSPENIPEWNAEIKESKKFLSVQLSAKGDVFKFVERGTKPHTIVPVNAKALIFIPGGGTTPVFTKRVEHPGSEGRFALNAVADKWNKKIGKIMQKKINAIVKETSVENKAKAL